jgi:hypothetical protein
MMTKEERLKYGRRVFIPIPTYQSPDYAMVGSLLGTQLDLYTHGILPEIMFMPPNPYLGAMRNQMVYMFRHTDCTHIMMWDTDVAAPAAAVRRLLNYNRDIIIAPYPKKVTDEKDTTWPMVLKHGVPDEHGLIEAALVATGFLLIKREVIDTLWDKHIGEFSYRSKGQDEPFVDLFQTGRLDFMPKSNTGEYGWWGEDYSFSQLACNAGFKIWVDPYIKLAHVGRQVWHGDFLAMADKEDEAA